MICYAAWIVSFFFLFSNISVGFRDLHIIVLHLSVIFVLWFVLNGDFFSIVVSILHFVCTVSLLMPQNLSSC